MNKVDEGTKKGTTAADAVSAYDPFEGFEVDSGSEKEFLIANLKYDAPKDEVERLRQAREALQVSFSTTVQELEYPASHLVLRENVEHFAQSHTFTVNKHTKLTAQERWEFTRDIYDYARAIGMGKHQANVEVMRAKAAYGRDRGLTKCLMLDESHDRSNLGLGINDAVEYITFMQNGMQRGPVDHSRAWEEVRRLQTKCVPTNMMDYNATNVTAVTREKTRGDATSTAVNNRECMRVKNIGGIDMLQKQTELTVRPSTSRPKEEQRGNRKRKHSSLSMPEGNVHFKSRDPLPNGVTDKAPPTAQLDVNDTEGTSGTAGATAENKNITAKSEETTLKKNVESSKADKLITSSDDFHNAACDNLRKRKKRRKRRKVDDATINIAVRDTKNDEAHAIEMKGHSIQFSMNPPNTEQVQKAIDIPRKLHNREREKDISINRSEVNSVSELLSKNSAMKKKGRRNRGTKKKAPLDLKTPSSATVEEVKDHHS